MSTAMARHRRTTAWKKVWAAIGTIVLALPLVVGAALPASAASEFLVVDKTVDKSVLQPGDVFTYTIKVVCSEQSCVDAQLVDALPAELAGFALNRVQVQAQDVPHSLAWTVDGVSSATAPAVVTASTRLAVDFTGAIGDPGAVGLENGRTFAVTLTLQVPLDMPVGDTAITNTATTSATNSAPGSSSADVTISVAEVVDVAVSKTWTPANQTFTSGAPSRIDLSVTNASNVSATSLVLQEPKIAVDGATTLDASNPFTITDLTGLTAGPLPAGADTVQVDAYVLQGGAWSWVTGTPGASAALPAGVDPAEVGGLRATYAGAEIVPGATSTVGIDLTQRAEHRNAPNGDLSVAPHTVDNVVQGTVVVPGHPPVTKDAAATYTITPAHVAVHVTKDISPNRAGAGETVVGTITATNTSDVGVDRLTIDDQGYFTDTILFDGFTAATWPATAATAYVDYLLSTGSTERVPFGPGTVPAKPSGGISGFTVVYEATGGAILSGATANLTFGIKTLETATGNAVERSTTNTATGSVTAPNGQTASLVASDVLVLVKPAINVTLNKSILPTTPVAAGESVVTTLATTLTTSAPDYIAATTIVVEDAWGTTGATQPGSRFWNGFDLASIAPTQVPSETTLTIAVQRADGTWVDLPVYPAQPAPSMISMTTAQLAAAAGVPVATLTGVRFTFVSTAAKGFPANTTVTPVVVSTARATQRDGGAPTAPVNATAVYTNAASMTGSGTTAGGTDLTASTTTHDDAVVDGTVADGPGGVRIDKQWTTDHITAQSGQNAVTNLSWRVRPGHEQVIITDSAGGEASAVADTVFDAFDLVRINPVGASSTPFSSGWFFKYDLVTSVELYHGGAWHVVDVPAGGWVRAGGFVGYTLTDAERRDVTAVRLTLAENTPARDAAATVGSAYDPYAPAPGSGVAASSADRTFALTWQIRNTLRSATSPVAFVTSGTDMNHTSSGIVENTVRIAGGPVTGPATSSDSAADTIAVVDVDPLVKVAKSVAAANPIYIPMEGAPATGLGAVFTVTAKNDSVARASYVRVTDPSVCVNASITACAGPTSTPTADPFTADIDWLNPTGGANPFDRFDLTKVTVGASVPAEVDLAATTVWLLRYDAATTTYWTEQTTAAAANALTGPALADVVGVSVTFQHTSPQTTGGTITAANDLKVTFATTLRETLRSSGAVQKLSPGTTVDVTNHVFAQSYDPVLRPAAVTGAAANATVNLSGGYINVAPRKSISPTTLTEPNRGAPITVSLGATQGLTPVSTLSPREVSLRDDAVSSPEFWSTFDFAGLAPMTAAGGADQVRVAVSVPGADGVLEWVEGDDAPLSAPVLPVAAERYGEVQGIRLVFSKADGSLFSATVPSPTWSVNGGFTALLRPTHRDTGKPTDIDATIDNVVTVQADRLNGEYSLFRSMNARLNLEEGTAEISVEKIANNGNHTASPGASTPWDLVFTNTGTGYLDITELRDVLPSSLVYLGTADPVYTADPAGLLSTDVTLTPVVTAGGTELVFTWPEGERRMAPGETFRVQIQLELQPGLTSVQRATNTMTVTTAQTLQACTNIRAGGTTTGAWATTPTTCGTTDWVSPVAGPNLFTVKGVRGSLAGAYNPSSPAQVCAPSLTATGGAFFRAPCVANSKIGGTDDWVLRVLNAGTVTVDEITVFDQLPVEGDRFLVDSTATRGTTFRPQVVADSLTVTPVTTGSGALPVPTSLVVEASMSPDVCLGTWSALVAAPPRAAACEGNSEVWVPEASVTDWTLVSGLRVRATFATPLAPGQGIDVTYSTTNVAATTDNPSGASSVVPAADSIAWNQFGVQYRNSGATTYSKIAPSRVGTHLLFGAIQIDKAVTGPAAAYAADEFAVDVVCQVGGVTLDLGAQSTVRLAQGNSYSHRIDHIPFGAVCTVTEQGAVGAFGETTRAGATQTVPVDIAYDLAVPVADQAVPAAQVASITNDFQFSGLSVTKSVDTAATSGAFGPFDFTLSCQSITGRDVTFAGGALELAFTLRDGETFTVPSGTVPVGATCALAEVGASHADEIVIVGDNVTDLGDGTATVVPGITPAVITVTNGYDAGVLVVEKVVDGSGAALYGTGPFAFDASCLYQGQTLLSVSFTLGAGATRSFGTYPAGTRCTVLETATGGATTATTDPADGTIVIPAPSGTDAVSTVTITATNTFDLGTLDIVKVVTGDGADLYGAGPFQAQAVCTWVRDGETVPVALPGGGVVTLDASGDYRASIGSLPVGAECAVQETRTGGATSTAIDPRDGTVIIPALAADGTAQSAVVTVTNTFDLTSVEVTKVVQGDTTSDGARGAFEVELVCSRDVDGAAAVVSVPGGSKRSLSAASSYRTTFDHLPVGASCQLTETVTGGADDTIVTVAIAGQETVTTRGVSAAVDLSATAPGDVSVTVTNAFDADAVLPSTSGVSGLGTLPWTGVAVGGLVALAAGLVLGGLLLLRGRPRRQR